LNDKPTRKFVGECRLHLMATIVATRHEDNVFPLRLGRGIEARNACQYGLLCDLKCQLDYSSFHERKVNIIAYPTTHGHNRFVFTNSLTAPATFSLKAFGSASE
jgi:hypothetical protein